MEFTPNVLVVDDDPLMLDLFATGLERVGAAPKCVRESRQAAEMIDTEKFDGIFLDWIMPKIDGLGLAKAVRSSKSNSCCPMVMVTGNSDPDAMRQCFRAGISFFLRKPVTLIQLQKLSKCVWDLMLRERLRYQRILCHFPVLCTHESRYGTLRSKGHVKNLSTTGVSIELSIRVEIGTPVQLSFCLPGDSQPFEAEGVVVRHGANLNMGVRLINLNSRQRWSLTEFSRSILEESLSPEI